MINRLLFIIPVLCSCINREMVFTREGWNCRNSSGYYDYREGMLEDLMEHYTLKGKNIHQLKDLFGNIEIDTFENIPTISFNIATDFGFDIDPVYTKDLVLQLDTNSIVRHVEIEEWRK